jgi:HlyD family secretion protein
MITMAGAAADTAVHDTDVSSGTRLDAAARPRVNRKLRKSLRWLVVVMVAAALGIWTLRPVPELVATATVRRGPLEALIDAQGVTRLRDHYDIAAPITGLVQRASLRAGDVVDAGTVIGRILPPPLDATTREQAQAQVTAARAHAAQAQTRVMQGERAFDQADRSTARLRAIAGAGAVSSNEMEQAELALSALRSELDAARDEKVAADAGVVAAQAALLGSGGSTSAVTLVRAPAAGRVLRVHETDQRVVLAGTPLLSIGDTRHLEVVIDLLSVDAVRVRPGAVVRIVDWGDTAAIAARVRIIEPQGFTKVSALGVEEQRVQVICDVLDAPPALGGGYQVQARIITWRHGDVLQVPASALFRTGEQWQVYVIADGRAQLRNITVGHRGDGAAEIIAGLQDGERVIEFPSDRIRAGARVRARGQ